MKSYQSVFAAMLIAVCGAAFADGGGTFMLKGKAATLKGAYAYTDSNPFDAAKPWTKIVFSERTIDAGKVNSAKDRQYALSNITSSYLPDKEERPIEVEIELARQMTAPIQSLSYTVPWWGGLSSQSSPRAVNYTVTISRNDDKRVEGTIRSVRETDKTIGSDGYYDLHFALDVAKPLNAKN